MDGSPFPKRKKWNGQQYSETRYAVIKWLEKELPLVSGSVIDVGAGNWQVPKQLLDFNKVKEYKTFDKKQYGETKNQVDFYGDIQEMPNEWAGKWDVVLCLEVIEVVPDIFKAFNELHRILKPNGTLLLSCPFNYRWFGKGSWDNKEQNKKEVFDYWRPTKQGLELLAKSFSKVNVEGFGGTGTHDCFVHCLKAVK